MNPELNAHIAEHTNCGCYDMSGSLGFHKMPTGYALILNADRTHFYWLRHDGMESCIFWNKWAVYRSAKNDAPRIK